jgi:phospholipid/cholesterol/gamma-HCH transport system ATP-binding protein
MASVIRVEGLTTRFGTQVIHDGLDLEVEQGEILGVVGGSGAGKSVLLRAILGLLRPDAGRVEVLGEEPRRLGEQARRALQARLGVLFKDGALFSSLTVGQNVQTPLRERLDLPQPLLERLTGLKLALVGLPVDACHKLPSQLSGGMRKRAGLARALALDPDILFLDEPTAGLDPIGAADFDRLIRSLQQSLGLTVLMVTHDLPYALQLCERSVILSGGVLVADGPTAEILGNADLLAAHRLELPYGFAAPTG